jgi:hypothetical protein
MLAWVFLSTGWSEKQTPPFQGRNTPFQVLFGGSAAVGETRRRKAIHSLVREIALVRPWHLGYMPRTFMRPT